MGAQKMSSVTSIDHVKPFMGEHCNIYDNEDALQGKGIFIFDFDLKNQSCGKASGNLISKMSLELQVTIKNIEGNLLTAVTEFKIQAVQHPTEEVYLRLEFSARWEHSGSNGSKSLIGTVNLNEIDIATIDEADYQRFGDTVPTIDWSNINTMYPGATGKEKEDAFEDLCCALIQQCEVENFKRTGKGPDGGKDAEFELRETKIQGMSFSTKWILQCKYSEHYSNLNKDEIYKEMVKVLQHRPDHLLIMTNRKQSVSFANWIESSLFETPYYIPFHVHIIGKDILDKELFKPQNKAMKDKFFPGNR